MPFFAHPPAAAAFLPAFKSAARRVVAASALWLWAWQPAFAQTADFPEFPGAFTHGSGFYLSWYKLLLVWLLFLLWVRSADWINQDGQRLSLDFRRWNHIAFFAFVGTYLLLWLLPFPAAFWVGFPLMFVAWLAPLWVYVVHRNAKVMIHQKVFTWAHLRHWLSDHLRPLGVKISAEAPDKDPVPLLIMPSGGATARDDNVNLLTARQSPAFDLTRSLLATALAQRASSILLDFTQQAVNVRYQIDGVWHNAEDQDRETGDAMLAVLKTVAALNPAERRARQQGRFGVEYEKKDKHTCRLTAQGTKAGERVLVQYEDPAVKLARFPALSMRDKMQEQFQAVLDNKNGFILVSAPPGGGLSSLFTATVGAIDRYVRGVAAVEEVSQRELEVENVPVTTYDAAAGQTPATVLPKLIREYPDVIAISDMVDGTSASIIVDQAADDRMTVGGIRARGAAEALLRVVVLGVPAARLAEVVGASINVRLVRKLCEACKEPYPPPPDILQKLGLPADRVEAFYRPPQPPADQREICAECRGIGYRGITGIFELLVVEDKVRAALQAGATPEVLQATARKAGMRTLQEEGLVLVVKGTTSLPELMRALKE